MVSNSTLFYRPIPELTHINKSSSLDKIEEKLSFLNNESIEFLLANIPDEIDILNLIPILSSLKSANRVLKILSRYNLNEDDLEQILHVLPNIKSFKTLIILKNLNLPEGAARDVLSTLKTNPEMQDKIVEIFKNKKSLFKVSFKSVVQNSVLKRQYTLDLRETLNLALKSKFFNDIFSNNQKRKFTKVVRGFGDNLAKKEITPLLKKISHLPLSDSTIDFFFMNKDFVFRYQNEIIWSEKLLKILNKFPDEKEKISDFLANHPGNEELFISIFENPSKIVVFLKEELNPVLFLSLAVKSEGFASFFKKKDEEIPPEFISYLENFIDNCGYADSYDGKVYKDLKILSNFITNDFELMRTIEVLGSFDKEHAFSVSLLSEFKKPVEIINILYELGDEKYAVAKALEKCGSKIEEKLHAYFSSKNSPELQNKPLELIFFDSQRLELNNLESFLLCANSPFLDSLIEKENFDFREHPIRITDKETIEKCLSYLKKPYEKIPLEIAKELYSDIHLLGISQLENRVLIAMSSYLYEIDSKALNKLSEFQQFYKDYPTLPFSHTFASVIRYHIGEIDNLKDFEFLLTIGRDCLTEVDFPYNGTDEWISKLEILPYLTSLTLNQSNLTTNGLISISKLSKIKELTIQNIDLKSKLNTLMSLKKLKKLTLKCPQLINDDIISISKFKNLEELDIDSPLIDTDYAYLFQNLYKLHTIVLKNSDFKDKHLDFLAHLKYLKELSLVCPNFEGSFLKKVSKNLNMLYLNCKNLKNLENFPKATEIHLYECKVLNNQELSKISESPSLKILQLNGCESITDEGLMHFNNLTSLTVLNIIGCSKFCGKGLEYLENLKKLQKLSLLACSLINEGVKQIPLFPQLNTLELFNNSKILGEEVRIQLKAMYPDVKISI